MGLANKVTRHLGGICRGSEPPLPRQAGQRECRGGGGGLRSAPWTVAGRAAPVSTLESVWRVPRSAPWTAAVRGAPRAPAERPAAPLRRCLGSSLLSACAPATATAVVLGAGGPGFPHRNLPSAGSRSGHQAGERGRRRGCRFAIRVVGGRMEGGGDTTLNNPGL